MKGRKDLRFGRLVVDFANAASPEEAGIVFIRGAARAFGYGPGFLEKALDRYPTLKRFHDALPGGDRELVELLLEERRLLSVINNLPCNILLSSYDYDGARTLTFKIQPLEPKWNCENPYEEDVFQIAVEEEGASWLGEVGEMFDDRAPLTLEMDEVKERLLACMEEYVALGERILTIRRAIPPEKTHEAQQWAAYYSRIRAEQEVLEELLERWRMTLHEIITTKDLAGNQTLQDLLVAYNEVSRRELAVGDDGAIYEKPLFAESYFTERAGLADEYYHNVLVYAFVEFLKGDGNRKRLRSCQACETFFIEGTGPSKGEGCGKCRRKKVTGDR